MRENHREALGLFFETFLPEEILQRLREEEYVKWIEIVR